MKKLLIYFLFFSIPVFSQYQVPENILNHIQQIDSNKIKAHVTYLADDKLLGRKPGKPGYQMAVDYVVEQFKMLGLKPAGEKGGYLQKVILRNTKLVKNSADISITLPNGNVQHLTPGDNFYLFPHPEKNTVDLATGLVFVGAGFDKPAFGLNDYKNIDVKGKIVVILRKIPDNLSENVKRHLTYTSTYQEFAAKNGAVGVILCNANLQPNNFKTAALSMTDLGINASVDKKGNRTSSSQVLGGKIKMMSSISIQKLKEIMHLETTNFDQIWKDLENGQAVSMPLKSTIKVHYESKFSDILSYNVLAKIEGSDKKLKKEFVIHSGHLDHIGVTKPVAGDSINNGAHDNASGIACSLEIARMYASLSEKPKRSILFAFVTAEEMGLLGSGYFTAFPTIKKVNLVADVNTDMPTIIAPFESAAPLGAEHSSMQTTVEQAASLLGLKVEPDPDPAEGRFVRSDQYNFLKAGIPAIHIKYGYKYSNPALNLAEKVKVFREKNYHQPSDEVNDSFNWGAGRKFAQLNFLVSYIIAQEKSRPTWRQGDFFNPN